MYKLRTFSFHWWDSRTPKAEKYLNRVTKLTDEMLKASQSVKSQIYFSVNSLLRNFLNILWLSIIMMSSLPSVLYISLLWLPSPPKFTCPKINVHIPSLAGPSGGTMMYDHFVLFRWSPRWRGALWFMISMFLCLIFE